MLLTQESQPAASSSGVELRGLRKTYRTPAGPIAAVRDVELAIRPGETVALLGPNGAGKSTTIDLLLGMQAPDAGSVAVFGDPPADVVARGGIGAMMQTGGLLENLTVRELLTLVAALHPAPLAIDDALALGGVQEIADRRAEKLSGGQTQRVRFALSLVGDPELLVLDEPTVGMDVEARQGFWATVRELARQGRTILFATHYLQEADAHADRAVLMAAGRVVADGPPTEISAMVGTRTVRATLPGVAPEQLDRLPGVARAERHGDAVALTCSDSDAAIRAFLAEHAQARDIEIRGAALEDAYLELTGEPEEART